MTTTNPMSVVIEALEIMRNAPERMTAECIRNTATSALPLARSMQEKLEDYDKLVEAKEELAFFLDNASLVKNRFGTELIEIRIPIEDCPTIIREMLGGKHE